MSDSTIFRDSEINTCRRLRRILGVSWGCESRKLFVRAVRKPSPVFRISHPQRNDDHSSKDADCSTPLATNPKALDGQPSNALLFGLAPGGVYQASPVTRRTGALLPHLFTLALLSGGFLSVALSFASPRLRVTKHPALRSSDFPPASRDGKSLTPAIIWTTLTSRKNSLLFIVIHYALTVRTKPYRI